MFHQILVILEDRDALRFIWRESEKEKFLEYFINVHIYIYVHDNLRQYWSD